MNVLIKTFALIKELFLTIIGARSIKKIKETESTVEYRFFYKEIEHRVFFSKLEERKFYMSFATIINGEACYLPIIGTNCGIFSHLSYIRRLFYNTYKPDLLIFDYSVEEFSFQYYKFAITNIFKKYVQRRYENVSLYVLYNNATDHSYFYDLKTLPHFRQNLKHV